MDLLYVKAIIYPKNSKLNVECQVFAESIPLGEC